jgi:hypothetical protein
MARGSTMSTNAREGSVHLWIGRPPSFIDSPHAIYSLLLPPMKPSPATKDSTTASTPWKPPTASSEHGAGQGPFIKRMTTIGRITRCPHPKSIWTIAPVGHRAKASSSTGHRARPSWSSSIKSWHKKHLLLAPETSSG